MSPSCHCACIINAWPVTSQCTRRSSTLGNVKIAVSELRYCCIHMQTFRTVWFLCNLNLMFRLLTSTAQSACNNTNTLNNCKLSQWEPFLLFSEPRTLHLNLIQPIGWHTIRRKSSLTKGLRRKQYGRVPSNMACIAVTVQITRTSVRSL